MDRWLKRANPTSSLLTTAAKKAKNSDDAAPSSSVATGSIKAAAAAASTESEKAAPAAAANNTSDGAMITASSSSLSVQITEQQVFSIGGMPITASDWAGALSNEFNRPYFTKLLAFLKAQKDKGKVKPFHNLKQATKCIIVLHLNWHVYDAFTSIWNP
jgi:hypothetical protein